MKIKVDHVNLARVEKKLADLNDRTTMQKIQNAFGKFSNPYVPMDEGFLSNSMSVAINGDYIWYQGPYAHYMYMGIVYGPNLPYEISNEGKSNKRWELNYDKDFIEGGDVVWRSPKNKKKYPTNRKLQYSKEKHDKATDHWDKAMMDDTGDKFTEQVKLILQNKLKRGY